MDHQLKQKSKELLRGVLKILEVDASVGIAGDALVMGLYHTNEPLEQIDIEVNGMPVKMHYIGKIRPLEI